KRVAFRRGAEPAADIVGRERQQHGTLHERILQPPVQSLRPCSGAAGGHGRAEGSESPSLLLGPFYPRGLSRFVLFGSIPLIQSSPDTKRQGSPHLHQP